MVKGFGKTRFVDERVCPWRHAYTFDNSLRRLFQKPEKILQGLVCEGQRVADIGCGMGFFAIAMVRIVGESGRVLAIDLQSEMLEVLRRRAERAGVFERIECRQCEKDDLKLTETVNFALSMWMAHEVPQREGFFRQIHDSLSTDGRYLLAEPVFHVTKKKFFSICDEAVSVGLKVLREPKVNLSRAMLFGKEEKKRMG